MQQRIFTDPPSVEQLHSVQCSLGHVNSNLAQTGQKATCTILQIHPDLHLDQLHAGMKIEPNMLHFFFKLFWRGMV